MAPEAHTDGGCDRPPSFFSSKDAFNPALDDIGMSKIIELFQLTQEMMANGETVHSMIVGEPDFAPPEAVVEATAEAARLGLTRYTALAGTFPLRKAIIKDLTRRKGTTYGLDEIVVCNGAKQAVYQGLVAVLRPGDEVIIPAPYWSSYPEMVQLAGGVPVHVETTVEDGYILKPEALRAAITPKSRVLIFCNPSNPTGAVHEKAHCEALAAVLREQRASKVWVMSDEIYERLTYDVEHHSFSTLPGMRERTMLINGLSKSHAMTGYRLGYIAAPPTIAKHCLTVQAQVTACPSSISQHAGVAALGVPDDVMQQSFDVTRQKRDYVISRLQGIPEIKINMPQGAFYALPDVSAYYGRTAPDGTLIDGPTPLCIYLLREHKVAVVTGEGFGYPKGIRLAYATSMDVLRIALDELEKCLLSLSSPKK